jgi:hypothetical protein
MGDERSIAPIRDNRVKNSLCEMRNVTKSAIIDIKNGCPLPESVLTEVEMGPWDQWS